jgi:hypothetical protein
VLRIEHGALDAIVVIHPSGPDLTGVTPLSSFRPRNMAWGSARAHRA